jgi:hypothetical protein
MTTIETRTRIRAYSTIPWPDWLLGCVELTSLRLSVRTPGVRIELNSHRRPARDLTEIAWILQPAAGLE